MDSEQNIKRRKGEKHDSKRNVNRTKEKVVQNHKPKNTPRDNDEIRNQSKTSSKSI